MTKSLISNNGLEAPRPLPFQPIGGDVSSQPLQFQIGALLGDGREAILIHNGEAYRLRITANNKLILTK